jgi:hypothetical protein
MATQEPQITQTDPRAYYYWLQSQGMSAYQASELVKQRFPPPEQKTPEQQQREAGKESQNAALAQTAGMVGGVVAGRYVYNKASGWFDQKTGSSVSSEVVQQAAQQSAQGASQAGGQAAGATPAADAAASVKEVGSTTMPDGSPGKLMSDGGKVGDNGEIVNPDGSSGGSISGQALAGLQIAGGAAQAYNGYRQYQSGEKLGGAANMAGGAYGAAAGAQALYSGGTAGSLAQYAPAVGTAVAAAQVGQQMLNEKGASEDRAAKSEAEAQKAALLWIPGYGWVAYAALAGLDAISGGKATQSLMKFNKAKKRITDPIDLGIGKSIDKKLFHQSTKGVQEMHTGQLMQQSDDPQWQNYVGAMRAQVKDGPKKGDKPFAGGKYASWGEYKKAGLEAADLTGVYGNLDAFKPDYAGKSGMPDWSKLSFDQQKAVTQRLIDEDMYSSKKGEVVIADKEKARRIYEEMAQTNFGVPQGAPPMAGPQVAQVSRPQAGQVARVSPGMYMNDKGKVTAAKSMRESLEQNYGKSKTKSRRR